MRIIYKNTDNTVAVLVPAQDVLSTLDIKAIAEKDVPAGLPYWIVKDSDIPSDRTFRDAWIIDETQGEPDGVGGDSAEFSSEQIATFSQSGVIE